MKTFVRLLVLILLCLVLPPRMRAQSLGNSGTIEGPVSDPSRAAVAHAVVTLKNSVTGYSQSVTSAQDGSFR